MEVLDLSKPDLVQHLVLSIDNGPTSFVTELTSNDDSDVEIDLPEEIVPDQRQVLPIYRVKPEYEWGIKIKEEIVKDIEIKVEENGWTEGIVTPDPVTFTGESGLQANMFPMEEHEENQVDATPIDFLHLMINQEMVETIALETNRYAADFLKDRKLSPASRFRKWVEVTSEEIWAFFGLIIAMGLIVVEDLDEYWSSHQIYNFPLFRSVMKRDRFCVILSFLHLCDNSKQLPKTHSRHDPLFKIRHFVEKLKTNFQRVFMPSDKIAIDTVMIAWRGPLSFRAYKYNPNIPEKCGIKVFELCDSVTGYCSNFEIYCGQPVASPLGAKFDVVNRLVEPYLGFGRTLFVDNCYTSPDLFTYLKSKNTLACGTLQLTSVPQNGPPKAMVPKLKRTDTDTITLTNGTLNLLRFFERHEVNILTTAHDDTIINTGKINSMTNLPISKLKAVHDYNKYMGAVDLSDHRLSFNAFKRRTLKWWKKAFFHMFMLGVLNAYIVHKATAKRKLGHRIFRRDLAMQLVSMMPNFVYEPTTTVNLGESSLLRLTARHFCQTILPKPGAKHQSPQRDCVVCSQPGRRKHSRYECRSCNVGLHTDPCFLIYHTCKDFKRVLKRKRESQDVE